ncbi:hypothetical protein Vretimale_9015 [Volvox reticuliferus]|uniref:ABC transporter domain-containing protein n=1 Tax=Volvox reticuliferus TaxID=1737510 RepID=A0A8J4GBY6_9CHLO|nr:hypothetical protein Vretifemale_14474 [Volvox reticuliferus]GIM04434.1 hypothetical protein Vretimale_9015 [Volvox reticuliferus]
MAHLEHIRGAFIEWQDVNFSVPDRSTGHQKRILTDMHGLAQPGRLLAIMGPSGAGKSTLLDILAGNSSSRGATCKGLILVDGSPRNVRAFRVISCYVQQKDVLMSSATVREVLLTSALLKLPRSVPLSRKRALVEDTIRELDLASCADTLIGDETIGLKGVSGGQKRRVSVGVELVKDPRILFLDEPSSGLDSEMALSVVTTLVRLARKGRTVVCTIHQPNSDITECFDDFLLLSSGRTVYGGLWSGAVDFFARNGFSCPAFKNPTDYFMSVVTREEGAVETLATAYGKVRLDLLQQMAAVGRRSRLEVGGGSGGDSGGDDVAINLRGMGTEDVCVLHDAAAAVVAGGGDGGGDGSVGVSAVVIPSVLGQDSSREVLQQRQRQGAAAPLEAVPERRVLVLDGEVGEAPAAEEPAQMAGVPLWFQVYVLSVRYWRTWIRNPVMMASELVQYIFTAIFIGLMYCSDELGFGTPAAEARAGPTVVRHHGILPCPLLSTGTFSNGPVFVVLGGYVLLCRIPGLRDWLLHLLCRIQHVPNHLGGGRSLLRRRHPHAHIIRHSAHFRFVSAPCIFRFPNHHGPSVFPVDPQGFVLDVCVFGAGGAGVLPRHLLR